MLVLFVLALTAVLGAAMLSSSALQSDVSATTLKSAEADALAESGVQIAEYYLLNPGSQPSTWPSLGFAPSQLANGSVNVSVGGTNPYTITSTATDSTDATGAISRVITSTVKITSEYEINAAITSNSALRLSNKVSLTANAQATSDVICTNFVTGGTSYTIDSNAATGGPTASQVNLYQTYTLASGQTGTAQVINGNQTISSLASLPAPAANNPGNVYYVVGNVTCQLTSPATFNGTLVVAGNVTLGTNSKTPTITPVMGLPALIITGKFICNSGATGLTANGVVFIGGGISTSTNTTVTLLINGALLIDTNGISAGYDGYVDVNYNLASPGAVPALSLTNQTPVSATVTAWSE